MDSDLSSPDPLATSLSDQRSFIASSPTKRKGEKLVLTTNPVKNISQTRAHTRSSSSSADVGFPPLSPSRTVTEQTLSPWRIRVTVEAEPEDNGQNIRTISRTTKVPLRNGSSPVQPGVEEEEELSKRRSGSTAFARSRRSVTPKGTSVRRRRQSVTDLDIVVLGDDDEEDEWGKKSKKPSARRSKAKKSIVGAEARNQDTSGSHVDENFGVRLDTNTEHDRENDSVMPSASPELRPIDLNRVSVRARGNSMKQKITEAYDVEGAVQSTEDINPHLDSTKAHVSRKVSANSTRSYPTPSPTPSVAELGDNGTQQDEPELDQSVGFDTVMESEGFTMIDLDSIPSVRHLRSSPAEASQHPTKAPQTRRSEDDVPISTINARHPTPARPFPSYLHLAEGESDISSAVPSSPPIPTSQTKKGFPPHAFSQLQIPSSISQFRHRHVTPQTYSSPSLPSPPRPPPANERSTPDSAQAMRAGKLLQGAIVPDPAVRYPNLKTLPDQGAVRDRQLNNVKPAENTLFEGFESEAQHELRAGLRFGEELAKRQQIDSTLSMSSNKPQIAQQPQVWRGEHVLHRTPPVLQTQNLSHPAKVPSRQLQSPFPSSNLPNVTLSESTPLETQVASRRQTQPFNRIPNESVNSKNRWQEERDAVLKEVQDAGAENVIVIDSDGEDSHEITGEQHENELDEEDGGDVWLAEAKDSSSSPRQENEVVKHGPFRSNKQQNIIEDESSALTNGEGDTSLSGLFWKMGPGQNEHVRFGAGQLRDTRRELRQSESVALGDGSTSGIFDIEKMLGTPKRIRESLEREGQAKGSIPQQHQPLTMNNGRRSPVEDSFDSSTEENSTTEQSDASPAIVDNDSVSEVETPPAKTRTSLSPSRQRPPTPRSAMKGGRQSFGAAAASLSISDSSDQAPRKVVWARRASHMDEDWIESSRSIRSEESSVFQGDIRMEENHPQQSPETISAIESDASNSLIPAEELQERNQSSQSGWFGWSRKDTAEIAEQAPKLDAPEKRQDPSQYDGSHDEESTTSLSESQHHYEPGQDSDIWIATSKQSPPSSSLPQKMTSTSSRTSDPSSRPRKSKPRFKLPSFLTSPSYPSDPTRSLSHPLSTSGDFTNTHFRTLHIIYAKSSRSRFHAPNIDECRPEIRKLVRTNWKMYVDEDAAGLGGFEFKLGEVEGRVLERFAREVEWDHLSSHVVGTSEPVVTLEDIMSGDGGGIWNGVTAHGKGGVVWDWSCEQLAQWLGRIVVGEVVREEEHGGRKSG